MMRLLAFHLGIVFLSLVPVAAQEPAAARLPSPAETRIDFTRDILPLLETHCFRCHRGSDASSGHRLDDRDELLGLNDGEPLVVAGRSADSTLVHRVAGLTPDKLMPPEGEGRRLNDAEIALLRAWIDQGVSWNAERFPPLARQSNHWAFQPIRRPATPRVANADWCCNPIDAFIAARHESLGVTSAGDADPRTLIRRLHLTLTGLPPTAEELAESLGDISPSLVPSLSPSAINDRETEGRRDGENTFHAVIDRLLASPYYAEHWARHWLDLARWAESEGYESNHPRPFAWRYRDYVVAAFREDKPYDRFIREQIAGDEITPYRDEHLIATGFLAAARLSSNEEDKLLQNNDVQVDIVNATGSVLLGLTIGCAQCHNHKLDPITQRDYYQFLGFFNQGQINNLALESPAEVEPYERAKPDEYDRLVAERDAIFAATRARLVDDRKRQLRADLLAAFDKPAQQRTADEERLARQADAQLQFTRDSVEKRVADADKQRYQELKRQIDAIEKQLPPRPQTWGFYSPVTGARAVDVLPMKGFYPPPYEPARLAEARPMLLIRGDVHRPGPSLDVTWPAVLSQVPRDGRKPPSRSQLADWLTSRDNPLVARVWVNRLWQHHFGRGIVATPSDFGLAGAAPTHPELLDWLACELIDSGWSTRHVQRLIVTSRTYRQSSHAAPDHRQRDPENASWCRWEPRRLAAEAIRDSLLCVTGELDIHVGGASVPKEQEETSPRRSLYLTQKREEMPRMFGLFDGAEANESCPVREVSTVALQPLYLLNSPWMNARAAALAERLQREVGPDPHLQLTRAFEHVVQRPPDDEERAAAYRFLSRGAADAPAALRQLCLTLFNLNEFVYVE